MIWIYLALFAYLLNAFSFIVDKYLLHSPIPRPFAYASGVAILSISVVVLIPFGVYIPSLKDLGYAMLSGSAFFAGLIFFYRSIKYGDITISATRAGVFTVLFSYIFSIFILKIVIVGLNLYAILFLVIGMLLFGIMDKGIFHYSLLAGAFFAFSLVMLKSVFISTDFINGIFWTRIGFVLAALIPVMVSSHAKKHVIGTFLKTSRKSGFIFVLNKILIGTGFLLLYYAISVGDVVIVNALQGFQFVFIFLFALLLQNKIPGITENAYKQAIASKVAGMTFIVAGFLLLIFVQ